MNPPVLGYQWFDWLSLVFLHYAMLSLISIGGVITTVPEMHRYLVEQNSWLTESQFSGSIAIAQAAHGAICCSWPNFRVGDQELNAGRLRGRFWASS